MQANKPEGDLRTTGAPASYGYRLFIGQSPMLEEQAQKKKQVDSSELKEELTEEELKAVKGAGCGCEDVPEFSVKELKGIDGGLGDMSHQTRESFEVLTEDDL